jgi:phosphoribosyl 1,2-cyclic phosphate phosphodiesterase
MRITMLGTGTSHGVPSIDCMLDDYQRCPQQVCRKALTDPAYCRTRASIHVQTPQVAILIDTSQDFRQQMLANRIERIDAVLYTHGHADHIYGLPDIRSYCHRHGGPIDIYGSPESLAIIQSSFAYAFCPPHDYVGGGIPALACHPLVAPQRLGDCHITPVLVVHGNLEQALGYRLNDIAYLPDVKSIPDDSMALLGGLDLLILNCLRLRPHDSHLSLAESVAYAERLAPKRCYLTHLAHDIDYLVEQQHLPPWLRFARDGLVLEV